jgi:hypothetical protein
MIQRLAVLCLISALLLPGCATKNDAGIVLHKKPDLTKVTPGTPVNKVASLKKPIKREVITKGELKGAEAWLYEWDAPNDEVNNKMFTSVVVKDGVILGYAEETPDKWRKNRKLHEAAKMASSWEDIAGHMAKAARYQAVANYLASRPAPRQSSFDPVQASQNFFAYRPWENAQPVNYGMIGGSSQAQMLGAARPQNRTAVRTGNSMFVSDGTSTMRSGNSFFHSDGTSTQKAGSTYIHSDMTTSQKVGNFLYHSDGTATQRIGNMIYHPDGSTTTVTGN